jgi:hypothetical protein
LRLKTTSAGTEQFAQIIYVIHQLLKDERTTGKRIIEERLFDEYNFLLKAYQSRHVGSIKNLTALLKDLDGIEPRIDKYLTT